MKRPRFQMLYNATQKAALSKVILGVLVVGSFTYTPILSQAEAAGKRVIAPRHRAAVLLPVVDQPDIEPVHRKLANDVLRSLPSACRNNLKNFYVDYSMNPANRGLAGADVVIVSGREPAKVFENLVRHEVGHVCDIGVLQGTPAAGPSGFLDGSAPVYSDDPSVKFYSISFDAGNTLKSSVQDDDFVSGYAKADPFEDFAETFLYFARHNGDFARLAKKNAALRAKYEFMQQYVFNEPTTLIASSTYRRGKAIPWDVTKLP